MIAKEIFNSSLANKPVTWETIKAFETNALHTPRDFITATAYSALNQALYELKAKKQGQPVWKLFAVEPERDRVPVYVTINRVLKKRTLEEYISTVDRVKELGFASLKCAPFEKVQQTGDQFMQSQDGLRVLQELRRLFPELGIRVDLHQRFKPESFFPILPVLNGMGLVWVEEPCPLGEHYQSIRREMSCRLAAGELFFGVDKFEHLAKRGWTDVIMPDVKHVGGFGPLIEVCNMALKYDIEVSPHNPAGPIATAASLHCAVLCENVTSLELAFDPEGRHAKCGEVISGGQLLLNESPGWGLELDS
jgi:galactonate dehydratase